MAKLSELHPRPLDVVLCRGVDPVSRVIRFFERKKFGHGEFSHAGLIITREALDLPFLERGRFYIWESILSATSGFWSHFSDGVPDRETQGVRFGVQIRDLEAVIPGYTSVGGAVAVAPFLGELPPMEVLREKLGALHEEYGHARFSTNLLEPIAVAFPALAGARDRLNRMGDRLIAVANRILEERGSKKHIPDEEHHVFCSEWCTIVYARLELTGRDPRSVPPVLVLSDTDWFRKPILLEPDGDPGSA